MNGQGCVALTLELPTPGWVRVWTTACTLLNSELEDQTLYFATMKKTADEEKYHKPAPTSIFIYHPEFFGVWH